MLNAAITLDEAVEITGVVQDRGFPMVNVVYERHLP
jgi:hypothetical protein